MLSADGTLSVDWETRTNAPAGALFVGIRVEEDPLAQPRYRAYQKEELRRSGRKHGAAKSVAKLLSPKYDVNGALPRGYGEIAWQVEQIEPETGSSVVFESRTAFRVEPARGDQGPRTVQLPTVVLGPFVHQVSAHRFIVSFETDVDTAAALAVGDGMPRVSKLAGRRHEIAVDGLEPGRAHIYQVAVSDGVETSVAPPRTVRTSGGSETVSVAILSDSRSGVAPGRASYDGVNARVLSPLLTDAARRGVEAVFFPGDLIDGYTTHPEDFDRQLRSWFRVVEGVGGSIPIYTGMGNHEAVMTQWSDLVALAVTEGTSAEAQFAGLMVNPAGAPPPERDGAPPYDETVYSVDIGSTHFVMLNTNYWYASKFGDPRYEGAGNREGFIMDGQMAWLEKDLADAKKQGARYIVVMGHEPSFPVGGHTKDAMWWHGKIPEVNAMRERFWKLLAEHDVLAYVSGDEHNYSRSLIGGETVPGAKVPVYSVISGGCGAPYYAQKTPPEYAERVQHFSAQQHYTLWTFSKDGPPRLTVVGLSGNVIEDVVLDRK